jgi:hypothetical protein
LALLLLTLPAVAQARYNYTTNNGTITITGFAGPGAAVTIPSTINGLPVTSIGNSAFSGTSLTSVTIPDSVTNIGNYAFGGCGGLASIMIGNSVTRLGASAFNACHSLASVTIPDSVTSIGDNAFDHCLSLTGVTIGNNVISIGQSAFGCCRSLASVTIPNRVASLGTYAFAGCGSLTEVYFQGDAPGIGSEVFDYDSNATVYYLPGTTGWGPTFAGLPTALWLLPNPLILNHGPGYGVQTNGFGFIISWATNLSVVVEASTNLANPIWHPLATNALSGGSFYFSDPQWTNYPGRFYRLRLP